MGKESPLNNKPSITSCLHFYCMCCNFGGNACLETQLYITPCRIPPWEAGLKECLCDMFGI